MSRTQTREVSISENHVISALEGYLQAISIINDDEVILAVKKDRRTGQFVLTVES